MVADEVRNLAQAAAVAAKNTSGLIQRIIDSVKRGNEITGLARTAFQECLDITCGVKKLVQRIAESSHEQTAAIEIGRASCRERV